MNRQLISISILLTLGPIFVQDSEILQLSENVAVVKGRAVEFRCQSSVGSKADSWSFAPVGFRTPVTFYHRIHGRLNNLTSFYNSTKSDEYLIIRTESVRMEDAGLFVCNIQQTQGTNTTIETKSAQLIVLESDPICNSGESLFTCSVSYRGNWAPVMEWRRGNADGTLITDGIQSSSTNQSVTSILTLDSKATSVSGVKIICRIFFSFGDNAIKATADNVPNYTYIWNAENSASEMTSTSGNADAHEGDEKKHQNQNLINIIIGTGAVMFILIVLLICISTRNFKKYSRGSVRPREIEPVNGNEVKILRTGRVSLKSESEPKPEEAESTFSVKSRKLSDCDLQEFRRISHIGADGTVYMAMGSMDKMNSLPIIHHSRYEKVVYASIDHTLKPLPPLPKH